MNNTTFEAVHAQVQAPFICVSLSALDTLISAGDPPYVYLVYSHIVRRAGYNGMCWESIPHMAKYLRISTGSTKRALSILLDHGLITRESRGGTTSLYRITHNLVHNTGGVGYHTAGGDHNNPVHNVDHNNLGHHMVGVDHNTGGVVHNNLGHHMAGYDHNIHPNLGHHMAGGGHEMAGGGHHMAGGGSPHGHKLDPYKLDPYKLDPNKLENHDHESDHFFSDDQEQNPNPSSEALDQKPADVITSSDHLDQKPINKVKIMPKLKSKQCNSNHPSDPSDRIESPQIDQNPHDPHAKPDTPCPKCDGLTNKFEIYRYNSCSFCWSKTRSA